MSLIPNLADAIRYADANYIDIPFALRIRARRVGAIKAGGDLSSINANYHDEITKALIQYFEGGNLTASRNIFKRSMVDAFGGAFDLGWTDGGQDMPPDDTALAWFNPRVEKEAANIDSLFIQAKELKKEKDFDYFAWITERADGYTRTISAIYNAAQMLAAKNQMLTWKLGDTEKHCSTCAKLDGQSHRAAWFISRNYIPRQPGAAMVCGGYNCDCSLLDNSGNEVTL